MAVVRVDCGKGEGGGGDFVVSLIDSRTSAAQCTIAFTADTQTQTNWGERGREGGRDF